MPKHNAFLRKMQEQHERDINFQRAFSIQQCEDMMLIAAHEEFGFGPDRAAKLKEAFNRVFREYAQLCLDDAKDDKDIAYTKAKVDARLRDAVGDAYVPWDERYGE